MAEICDNDLYFYCEDPNIINIVSDRIESFECGLVGDIYESTDTYIEGFFDSDYEFPKETLDVILKDIPKGYLRCISQELVCGYIAVHVWKDGKWIQEEEISIKS